MTAWSDGQIPIPGDRVYLDFGDGVLGGEVTGTVEIVTASHIWIRVGRASSPYLIETIVHGEVLEPEGTDA